MTRRRWSSRSGERLLAERIRQAAREAGVPIFRDVTLARSLRDLPEGQEIPAALYEAVAEILRAVYAMPGAGGGGVYEHDYDSVYGHDYVHVRVCVHVWGGGGIEGLARGGSAHRMAAP